VLQYRRYQMRWKGGDVPLTGAISRQITPEEFLSESGATKGSPTLADFGIRSSTVTEVDLQHEDADITGATTEVPGDTILVAGPGRLVVSACGIYMEARRVAEPLAPPSARKAP
jgi:hypothetical protein